MLRSFLLRLSLLRLALVLCAFASSLQAVDAVWLGEYTGGGTTRPAIYTNVSFPAPNIPRLQCRFLNVPGGGYLDGAATPLNQGQRLDRLPPPGVYTVELFYEMCYTYAYGSGTWSTGPKTTATFTVLDSVRLSSYAFLATDPPPTILTSDALPTMPAGRYKLRAKIMGVPSFPDGFHAATKWDNNGQPLDFLNAGGSPVYPPPNVYPAGLYWLKYDNTGSTLLEISPFNDTSIALAKSQVTLTSYWFNAATRPAISSNQAIPEKYKLSMQIIQSSNVFLDTTLQYFNQGLLLDWIPAAGTYRVKMFWTKYSVTGDVIATGAFTESEEITVTSGPLPLLNSSGHISVDEWDDENNDHHSDSSEDIYDFAVPTAGTLRVHATSAQSLSHWMAGPQGYVLLESPDGGAGTFSATVHATPGVYRLVVTGDAGDYQVFADLTPDAAVPAVVVPNTAIALIRNQAMTPYTLTTTAPADTITVIGLPPGLSYNPGTRTISGTPTVSGLTYVHLYATNSSGNGPTTTLAIQVGLAQTITFPGPSDKVVGAAPFDLIAASDSGLPVSFILVSGPATLSGKTVTLSGTVGTVAVRAVQDGDSVYAPAALVNRSFAVNSSGVGPTPPPPTIVNPPVSQSVAVGRPVVFGVGVSGTGPFSYQWLKGGVAISGATQATFGFASVVLANAGDYSVQVTNDGGTVTSAAATLTVQPLIDLQIHRP